MVSARPTPAASSPWSSAWLPRVAETWVSEINLRSTGRAPMRRLSARSLAAWKSPTFSICAPVRPSMPSGFWTKSIVARETIWSSRVMAKRWKDCSLSPPGLSVEASKPRSAIRLVTRANASRPLSLNSIDTSGALVLGSVLASGFLMS